MKTKITFILIALNLFFTTGDAQTWSTLSSGTNGTVFASAVYNGELYAGGTFTLAGGIAVNNIAKWNGTAWSTMPGIFGSLATVRALIVFNGELYAGGTFTQAGTLGSNSTVNIAKWDGTAWSPVGAGQNSRIAAFAIYNSELYAGGAFTNGVAKWNGTAWSAVGAGLNNSVAALAVYNSELYAGGLFTAAPSDYVAKWNGTAWSAVSTGTNGSNGVYALTTYNSELYIGGNFTMAGTVTATNIVKWNGTSFVAFGGTGPAGDVRSLVVYGTSIYAGGLFNSVNGNPVHCLVQWDGTVWTKLLGGLTDVVNTLCVYNNDLYAGGLFNYANNNTAYFIAKWNDGYTGITGHQLQSIISVYPNPVSDLVTLTVNTAAVGQNYYVSDVTGKQVLTGKLNNEKTIIDLSQLSTGMYFIKANDSPSEQSFKVLKK